MCCAIQTLILKARETHVAQHNANQLSACCVRLARSLGQPTANSRVRANRKQVLQVKKKGEEKRKERANRRSFLWLSASLLRPAFRRTELARALFSPCFLSSLFKVMTFNSYSSFSPATFTRRFCASLEFSALCFSSFKIKLENNSTAKQARLSQATHFQKPRF